MKHLLLATGLFALPGYVQAQVHHYVPGVEGIKAASLPPPGIYVRDYNVLYFANRLNGAHSEKAVPDFSATVYANVIRPIWITKCQILGGNLGADIIIPLQYTDLKVMGAKDSVFGLGDICIEPATISWHGQQYDFAVGVAAWLPTGEKPDAKHMANPGLGLWSLMFTFGGTWYPTEDKTWAMSILNRYEIHSQAPGEYTPGNTITTEWGFSKSLKPTIEVGLIGYFQQQINDAYGPGVAGSNTSIHERVVGFGPEVNLFCSKLKMFGSIRYAREFSAEARPEGNTVTLTLTKIF